MARVKRKKGVGAMTWGVGCHNTRVEVSVKEVL